MSGPPASPPPAGERDLDALYRAWGPVVLRRSRALLGDEHEAREILQDLFLSLAERPGQLDGVRSPGGWFYRAATHACLNRIRDRKNRQRLVDERVAPARATVAPARAEAWVQVRDLLERLPPELARVAVYTWLDGMTQREIAPLLGCSHRHVGNLQRKVQARLAALQASDAPPAADAPPPLPSPS